MPANNRAFELASAALHDQMEAAAQDARQRVSRLIPPCVGHAFVDTEGDD